MGGRRRGKEGRREANMEGGREERRKKDRKEGGGEKRSKYIGKEDKKKGGILIRDAKRPWTFST